MARARRTLPHVAELTTRERSAAQAMIPAVTQATETAPPTKHGQLVQLRSSAHSPRDKPSSTKTRVAEGHPCSLGECRDVLDGEPGQRCPMTQPHPLRHRLPYTPMPRRMMASTWDTIVQVCSATPTVTPTGVTT